VTTPTEGAAAQAAPPATKADAWNSAAALDPYEAVAKYMGQRTGGGGGGGDKPAAAKAPIKGSVVTFNKLAAAAKGKGVQSVTSFFGKKAP
jgi:hypothetical protein